MKPKNDKDARAKEFAERQADSRSSGYKALGGGVLALALGIAAMYKFKSLDAGVEQTLIYVGLIAIGVYALMWGTKTLITVSLDEKRGAPEEPNPDRVALVHARYRHLTWLIVNAALGILFAVRFGTVGLVLGMGLLAWAGIHGIRFARTVMQPAGEFVLKDAELSVPSGLCKGEPVRLAMADIAHVYFLRRSAPWNRAVPVLVVETAGQALAYPRDWFATDADQVAAFEMLSGSSSSGHGKKKGEKAPKSKSKSKSGGKSANKDKASEPPERSGDEKRAADEKA